MEETFVAAHSKFTPNTLKLTQQTGVQMLERFRDQQIEIVAVVMSTKHFIEIHSAVEDSNPPVAAQWKSWWMRNDHHPYGDEIHEVPNGILGFRFFLTDIMGGSLAYGKQISSPQVLEVKEKLSDQFGIEFPE